MRPQKAKKRTAQEEAKRQAFVRQLGGKYAFTTNSSVEFARRKAEEIKREERVRDTTQP